MGTALVILGSMFSMVAVFYVVALFVSLWRDES